MKLAKILNTSNGILHLVLAIFHAFFWNLFNWKNDLNCLSVLNRNILLMLNICFTVFLAAMGLILILQNKSLLSCKLGNYILIFLAILYFVRFILEFALPGGEWLFGLFILVLVILPFVSALISIQENKQRTLHI